MKDIERLQAKEEELRQLVFNALPEDVSEREKIASLAIASFCELTPPEIDTTMHWISLKSNGWGGGSSHKPGNIFLNWRRLFKSVPNIVLTGVGAVAVPILWPFVALVIWNEIWSQSKIDISFRHGLTIFAMWKNKDESQRIKKEKAFECVNSQLLGYKYPNMTLVEFDNIINDLKAMECIEIDGDEIWLREWVKSTY